MGESSQHQRSRLGLRNNGGEIVEVQGGHIVRSTGRKDRHSKVCTAKGPRDRRVRLAAHTAIQFYDVQDRLGYDRPSKAVDWLIKKAKSAIDELAELPAWHPTNCLQGGEIVQKKDEEDESCHNQQKAEEQQQEQQQQQQQLIVHHADSNPQNSSFLPPALDSDAIADTIKSFFPMGASAEASSSSMPQFQSFQSPHLLSRNNSSNNNSQDLRLSLQSLQEPIMLHHNPHSQQQQTPLLLSGTPLGFESSTPWPDHHHFQRLPPWNSGGDAPSGSAGGAAAGYLFNSTPPQLLSHNQNHNQFFTQRGPLQSSNTPSVRAWIDPSALSDHSHHHHLHSPPIPVYPSSISGIGFPSGISGFPGFHIPTRIQGDEEDHDGYSDKPSSASSNSHR